MEIELKLLKCFADAKDSGDKLFEVRDNNDKGFQKGDIIRYIPVNEYGIAIKNHPILNKRYEITYVTNYKQKDGWVVFGEREITTK